MARERAATELCKRRLSGVYTSRLNREFKTKMRAKYTARSKHTVNMFFARSASRWCKPNSPFRVKAPVDAARLRWLARWCAPLLISIAVCGCRPAGLVQDGVIDEQGVDRIIQNVQKAATIQYLRPVKAKVVTLAMARKFFADSEIDDAGGKETLRAMSQLAVDLGQAPSPNDCKCDPRDATSILMRSLVTIMGAYEDSPDWVALIEGSDERARQFTQQLPWRQRIVSLLRHPLAFLTQPSYSETSSISAFAAALIDQHFAVSEAIRNLRGNRDERAALAAVEGGETSLIRDAISLPNYDAAAACNNLGQFTWWDRVVFRLAGINQAWVTSAQGAAYMNEQFVCEAYKRGGWAAVNGLYRAPPRSSQQILYPTLYYDHFLLPMRVTLAGYQDRLSDWAKLYESTWGELWLWQLLGSITAYNLSEAQVAAQWAGDRMVVLQKGDRVTAIWLIVFRDKLSATTFYQLYRSAKVPATGDEIRTAAKNDSVLIVVGDAAKDLEQLAPAIWSDTRIKAPDDKERQP